MLGGAGFVKAMRGRVGLVLVVLVVLAAGKAGAGGLQAGAAVVDITPPPGYPMWGYAARKDAPCEGTLDPLLAKALVLRTGERGIALVSVDLGRAPTRSSLARICQALQPLGLELFIVASHTHHGPVIELDNWPRSGPPYVRTLEERIIEVVRKADEARQAARYGLARGETRLNRNRQSRLADPPVDRELALLRVENAKGEVIAHAVNFAAHPTMRPMELRKFSADFVGPLTRSVEKATGAPCLFLQGAAGDLSPNPPPGQNTPEAFGALLAEETLRLLPGLDCTRGAQATLATHQQHFRFASQVDVNNVFLRIALERAFFPELIAFFRSEYAEGVRPSLSVAVLDGRVGFVGVSGEFFCGHSLALKRRARLEQLFFLGYCNDYQQYFPTIESASEGGYGTQPPIASVELGAGERVMDAALIALYRLRGKLLELK